MKFKLIMFVSIFILLNLISVMYVSQAPDMFLVMLGSAPQLKSPSLFYAISVLTILLDVIFLMFWTFIGCLHLTNIKRER